MTQLFKVLKNAWRVEEIRKKLLFIFLLLLVYRLGSTIPLPGIDLELLYQVRHGHGEFSQDTVMTIFAMISGGGIGSIFAMGIAPFITASIIMQLLTYAIPSLSELQKDGDTGRKKIEQITRHLAVGLAVLQGIAMVYSYTNWPPAHGGFNLFHPSAQNMLMYVLATVTIVTGTVLIMWLAEWLTKMKMGNGASFLIFANILAGLPNGIISMWHMFATSNLMVLGAIQIILILFLFVAIIVFVVWIHEGERRLPVKYSRSAISGSHSGVHGGEKSYIPLKVNIAGVMSIIFALSLLQFPAQVAMFFPSPLDQGRNFIEWIAHYLSFSHPVGAIAYIVLIFMFTHFYTSFAVNPVEMAESLKKNGGFIPGIRSGKPTSDFIGVTVNRLSWIGAVFYSMIALIPILLQVAIPSLQIGFGGTTLLIITGVALEFVKQLESQLLVRHHKGFLG